VEQSFPLSVDSIRSTLATKTLGQRIELFEQLASTNVEAVALGRAGASHGTVVIADRQTAGRGRLARSWFSPAGANIYASIVARPPTLHRTSEWLSWLPLIAALAAAEAIESIVSVHVALKWPNDLLLSDQKVGGILCENVHLSPSESFQVIGVGINVNLKLADFPLDLRQSATSLQALTGMAVDRNRLIAQFLSEMEGCLTELTERGTEMLAMAYQRRSSTIGGKVRAILADGKELTGYAASITADGSLRLMPEAGRSAGQSIDLRAADIVHLRS
jgi:BirA family biotin operon repressor/biotin-[acetyl-CoA-carboxylase] ligase